MYRILGAIYWICIYQWFVEQSAFGPTIDRNRSVASHSLSTKLTLRLRSI
ncbi:capsular polysaccharide synthesis enzyme cpsG Lipid A core-O-antigen ligase domain protein [Vibrio parahaemolyticus EKP-028]|nr:capsular polysaccharide synthesis enzyme cpsG Lipid A core-O-antigen ligase domain protein [Vibrio parahaemolyticus EKP-028]